MVYQPEYSFVRSKQVIQALEVMPEDLKDAFAALLPSLQLLPYNVPGTSSLRVRSAKDPTYPGMKTVPFGEDGLLTFRVLADYPIIELRHVMWLRLVKGE